MSQPHLKPYAQYKDSGIDWLGEVPAHWNLMPIKAVATCNDDVLEETTPDNYEIEYVEISGVGPNGNGGILETTNVSFAEAPSRARRRVKDGDVIVSTVRTYLRAIAPIISPPENLIVSTGFAVIRPCSIHTGFLSYIFQTEFLIAQIIARSVGVSYPAINASELMRLHIPIPLTDEQPAIAEFLDRETGKIDALVAEQRRLIDLLKEKRQAVISHAVTKGLNPNAPMKDSGIEWLGQIPAHWFIKTIAKSSNKITNGYVGPTRDILVEEGIPYIQATHIKNGRIQFDNAYFVTPEWSMAHQKSILEEEDVLIVQTGAGTGDVGLVTSSEVGYNCHALIIISPNKLLIRGEYLSALLQSSYGRATLTSIQTGAMHPHLNCGEVKFITIPIPSLEEQAQIVSYLSKTARHFDELIVTADRAIELLQERRTALISAAVTGKIDVRQPVKEKELAFA